MLADCGPRDGTVDIQGGRGSPVWLAFDATEFVGSHGDICWGRFQGFFPDVCVLGLPDAEPRRAVHIRKSGKCQRCAWRLPLASPSPNSEGVSEDCSAASPVAGVVPIVRRMPVRGRQVADQLISGVGDGFASCGRTRRCGFVNASPRALVFR